MAGKKRQSKEPGHSRKFLVISDNSPESECALRFAACRAQSTGGKVTMLRVIEPGDFQHWLGVEEVRRGEALAEAQAILRLHTRKMKSYCDIEPEHVIREGNPAEEIVALIDEDPDIAILVLGASPDNEGPGPLVNSLASKGVAAFPIPVIIVPGTLTDEEINALV
ncbi:MAG: universal stress protein [Fimbriimonadaceae bacterium]|nr:universal stress protein [Alphaproteobacteria bacterium]